MYGDWVEWERNVLFNVCEVGIYLLKWTDLISVAKRSRSGREAH